MSLISKDIAKAIEILNNKSNSNTNRYRLLIDMKYRQKKAIRKILKV
jgi:hypothetical protein